MRHNRLCRINRAWAYILGLVSHVINHNCRVRALGIRLIYKRGAACARAAREATNRRHRRCLHSDDGLLVVMQLGQGNGKVSGVDELIGRILELDLPAVGRARWGADEEQLPGVRQLQALILDLQGGVIAEVDLEALAVDVLAVPVLPNGDGGVFVEEADDDSSE